MSLLHLLLAAAVLALRPAQAPHATTAAGSPRAQRPPVVAAPLLEEAAAALWSAAAVDDFREAERLLCA